MHYHDECAKDHSIPAEHLEKYKHQHYDDSEEAHCHIKCLSKKIGIFDEDTGLLGDNMVHQVASGSHKTEDEVRQVVEDCNKEVEEFKADHCLHAYKGFMCLRKHHLQVIDPHPDHVPHTHEHGHTHDHAEKH